MQSEGSDWRNSIRASGTKLCPPFSQYEVVCQWEGGWRGERRDVRVTGRGGGGRDGEEGGREESTDTPFLSWPA